MSLPERIEQKFTRGLGCWEWTAATANGYGYVWSDGRVQPAHRVVYEGLKEPIPDGLHIDHTCHNRRCVNPEHLEPVTCGENTRRGYAERGRRTHCKRGHRYTPESHYTYGCNRHCKTCIRERYQERKNR